MENKLSLPLLFGCYFLLVGLACFLTPLGSALKNSTNYLQDESIPAMVLRLFSWFWLFAISGAACLVTGVLLIRRSRLGLYLARAILICSMIFLSFKGFALFREWSFLEVQTMIIAAFLSLVGVSVLLLCLLGNDKFLTGFNRAKTSLGPKPVVSGLGSSETRLCS